MTSRLQRTVFAAARASGLTRGVRWWRRKPLLALTYHSVVSDVKAATRSRYAPLYRNAVSAHHFEQQMRFLQKHYQIIGEKELSTFLKGHPLPERAVLLTFDDGLKNNATVAWPILKEIGLSAFFFLPTAFLDQAGEGSMRLHWSEKLAAHLLLHAANHESARAFPLDGLPPDASTDSPERAFAHLLSDLKECPAGVRSERLRTIHTQLDGNVDPMRFPADASGHSILETMTWDEARQMQREGAVMGAHTEHHEILSRLPPAKATAEIRDSLHRVTEEMGAPCRWFAYPNGTADDFNAFHQRFLTERGCKGAFTQIKGFNERPPAAPMALRRFDVSPDHSLDAFRYVVSGAKQLVDRLLRRS